MRVNTNVAHHSLGVSIIVRLFRLQIGELLDIVAIFVDFVRVYILLFIMKIWLFDSLFFYY